MTERNTAIFNPDEYPPKNFTLSFSASNKYPITIDILAYVQASKNQIVKTAINVLDIVQ